MKAFLDQVSRHYFQQGGISSFCFVFPNRRSEVFFKKYLQEVVKESGQPIMAPGMLTMNEFFFSIAGSAATDKVHLLLKLYDCYKALYPNAEPLDDFIFWGDVILSDFDDVDKYLADPDKIFTNIADFKSIQDSFEYLSEKQETAIRNFLSNFRTGGKIKEGFLRIWKILLPLYRDFNAVLEAEGLSYEGMAYRKVATALRSRPAADVLSDAFPKYGKFVFCGLNALNACERLLLGRMRDAGIAEFCWDYSEKDGGMICDSHNKSSLFLSRYFHEFPQAFDLEDPEGVPEFKAVSIPSAIGQAKLLPDLIPSEAGIETAIVLPDETMLMPVLNSIPPGIDKINVTMGYPMGGSQIWALMNDIAALQLNIRTKGGKPYFYHRQVWSIFANSLFRSIAGPEGAERAAAIKSAAKYYIPEEDFSGIPFLELVFKAGNEDIAAIGEYQKTVILHIAEKIRDNKEMAMELDFAREFILAIGRLGQYRLDIKPQTYFRLLDQLLSAAAIPFKGEPLEGLQIMAPLETRGLDFRHLVILNCNEGIFPRKSVSSSFIPPELRKGFELPTYEYQDAVWAYYFYRMIRRADTVTMVYDSRPDVSRSGEESRYIKQLEMHFNIKVKRVNAIAPICVRGEAEDSIPKKDSDIATLKEHALSATALQNYLSCQAKFYYHNVLRLQQKDEVMETVDSGIIGNVLHDTMQELYQPFVGAGPISKESLESILKDRKSLREKVGRHMMGYLHSFEISGRNILYQDIICRYVEKILEWDLSKASASGYFCIAGTEKALLAELGGYKLYGRIDRIDSFSPQTARIVDYKTGRVKDEDINIDEGNAAEVVDAVFGDDNAKRPKIALQLFVYDYLISLNNVDGLKDKVIFNSIYQMGNLFLGEAPEIPLCPSFIKMMKERTEKLMEEISDTSIPWSRTKDEKVCSYCDFKTICGKL